MNQKHINKQLSNKTGADGGGKYTPSVIPHAETDEPTTLYVQWSCNLATNGPIYTIKHAKWIVVDILDPFCNLNHDDWTIFVGDVYG